MKTTIFGALMGLFGGLAVFISLAAGWPGWILFLAWVCFYLYGKSVTRSLSIYLQIGLGVGLGVLIEVSGHFFTGVIGGMGLYLAIFLFIGSLAFLIKIKGLHDLTAWFFGLIIFFGAEPRLNPLHIGYQLLLPLAAGFVFGYVVDQIVTRLVFGSSAQSGY